VIDRPVALLDSVRVAPGIIAPDASVTVPLIADAACCAERVTGFARNNRQRVIAVRRA
jgi:hypothetical protein